MNHTKNYGLPQWELNDLIKMEDFNSAMSNIENGLNSNKSAAEAGDAELQRQVNAANAKAEAAQSAAGGAYSPAFKPYAVGSYVGNGQERRGGGGGPPRFFFFSPLPGGPRAPHFHTLFLYGGITSGESLKHRLIFTDTGFIAVKDDPAGYTYPNFTLSGRRYDYIAFR